MLYFNVIGTIADVDSTTPDSPLHPSPVLLVETDEAIERIVLPERAWSGPTDVLQIGRRVHVAAELEFFPRPGSLSAGRPGLPASSTSRSSVFCMRSIWRRRAHPYDVSPEKDGHEGSAPVRR